MTKTVLAIAANEGWNAECLDVKAAFLQGEHLDQDVFVKPPPEVHVEGEIWKLNKAAYGLYDSARKWYVEKIEAIKIENKINNDKPLNKEEFRELRQATGQISWLASQTRTDLGYDLVIIIEMQQ